MASNKNQHFVPLCYLRNFSADEERRSINLYNFNLRRSISNAPLQHQCSRDYFYGRSKKLEEAIRSVENAYAEVIRLLRQTAPAISERERAILRRFVYLQHLRTEANSRRVAEMALSMFALPGDEPPSPKEARESSILVSMKAFAETMGIVDDLRLVIIVNNTEVDFVTSDDPSVLTNRWYLQKPCAKHYGFGVGSAGIVLLLPLSPRLCCVLYDSDVYAVHHSSGWITSSNKKDIIAINDHQFLYCSSNIYFQNFLTAPEVGIAAESALRRRIPHNHVTNYAVLDQETEWGKRYKVIPAENVMPDGEVLVHVAMKHHNPLAWPKWLRYRATPRVYSNSSRTGYTRRWCLDQGFVEGSGYRQVRT